jgi:outer membrane protein
MKKIIGLIWSIFFISFSSLGFAEIKVAYIDLNKILTETPQIQQLQIALDKAFDVRGKSILNAQQALLEEIKGYNKNPQPVNLSALTPEQQKITDEYRVLQEAHANFQKDVVASHNQARLVILNQIAAIVSKIARQQKFDIVMTKMMLAYNGPQFDITEQVIAELKNK